MRTVFYPLLLASGLAVAQMPAEMEKAMACMESVDLQALEQLAEKGKAMEDELKALCGKGDEAGARRKALAFARELDDNESIQQIRKCSEMMAAAMPGMPGPEIPDEKFSEEKAEDICSQLD